MLEPGVVLQKRYTIREVIGRGGMGTVYLAELVIFAGRTVAIKQMDPVKNPEDADKYAAQFLREAQMLGSLRHPGLVEVKDYFEEDGSLYLVMEYVQGESLEALLRQQEAPFPLDRVVDWMLQVFQVLEYLHGTDPPIIFQDLKPSNLMLDTDGRIRLIDFGIARTIDPTTKTITLVRGAGTPGYAAPEQHGGFGGVPGDVYSAGATMYALLSNTVPPSSLHLLLGSAELQQLSTLNPQVTAPVEEVIYGMMALLAADRFDTVAKARMALERAVQEPQGTPHLRLRPAPPKAVPGAVAPASGPGFRIRRAGNGLAGPPSESRPVMPSGPELRVKRPSDELKRTPTQARAARACPGCGASLEPGQLCKRCAAVDAAPAKVVPAPPAPLPDPLGTPSGTAAPRGSLFRRDSTSTSAIVGRATVKTSDDEEFLVQMVHAGDFLVFNATEWFELGKPLRLHLSLVRDHAAIPQSSVQILPGSMVVTPTHWVYYAQLAGEPKIDMARYLKLFDLPRTQDRRVERRLQARFRVSSKHIPNFQAISTDISAHGLALLTSGPVQVGSTLHLRLDFDDDRFTPITTRNRVRWCYYGPDEYRVGTHLEEISAEHRTILASYLEYMGQHKDRWSS